MLELENKQHIDQLDRLTLTVNESRAELALAKNSEEHRFSVLLHDLLAARESYEHILTDERTARAQLERTICQMSEEARASRHIEDSLRRHLAREARKAEVLESQMERAQTAIDRSKRAEAAAEESDELARAWQDCAADAEIRMRMAEKKAVVAERQVAELRKQLELFRSPSSLPSASPSLNTNGSSSSIAPQARPGKARISSEERHRSSPPALSNQKLRQGNHASPLRIPLRPLHLV